MATTMPAEVEPLRKVMFIGPSGFGKSWLSNKLLGKKMFKSSGTPERETTEVSWHEARINVRGKNIRLRVFDTPGVPDTSGDSVLFLNKIMAAMKKHKPHLLVLVTAETRVSPAQVAILLALKECLGGAMSLRNVVFLWNKAPSDETLEEDEQGSLEEVAQRYRDKLIDDIRLEQRLLLYPNQVNQNNAIKPLLKHICNLSDEPVGVGQLRTWTEVIEQAEKPQNADEEQAAHLASMKSSIGDMQKDVSWYETFVKTAEKLPATLAAAAAMAGPEASPFGYAAGTAIHWAAGFIADWQIGDRKKQIEKQQAELAKLEKDKKALQQAAEKANKEKRRRIRDLKALVAEKPKQVPEKPKKKAIASKL